MLHFSLSETIVNGAGVSWFCSFSSKEIVISAGMCSALFFSKAMVVSADVSFLCVFFLFKGNSY